jgi:hypothetical protein
MRQSLPSVLPETDPAHHDHRRRARAPVVERVAGWSSRHRKTAVLGWLFLVVAVFAVGQMLGTGAGTVSDHALPHERRRIRPITSSGPQRGGTRRVAGVPAPAAA